MEINRTNSGQAAVSGTSTGHAVTLAVSATANTGMNNWRSGQNLEALIIHIANSQAHLKLGNMEVTIDNPLVKHMRAGQILEVQVEQGLPAPKIRLLIPDTAKIDMLNQAIRNIMPQQGNLQPVLQKLQPLLSNPALLPNELRPQLQQAQSALLQSIPVFSARPASENVGNIKPAAENYVTQIKNAMANAPVFTHHLILQHVQNNREFPLNNTHIQLLRMADMIRQILNRGDTATPTRADSNASSGAKSNPLSPALPTITYDAKGKLPLSTTGPATRAGTTAPATSATSPQPQYQALDDLLKATDGALAKTQTQQLQMLRTENSSQPVWLFDLPLKQGKNIDNFEFIIHRDPEQQQNEYQQTWQVQLRFNLPGLGSVLANIRLHDRNTIDVNFITHKPRTADLFKEHINTLIEKLKNNDISPGQMTAEPGNPETHLHISPINQSVIEDKI